MGKLRYIYPVSDLQTGSSLGNSSLFAQLDARTNLVGLWSAGDNQFYAGQWTIAVEVEAGPLLEESSTFEPASQTTHLKRGECFADKLFFLPFVPIDVGGDRAVSRTALYLLRLSNGGRNSATFRVRVRLVFPAQPSDLFTKKPPAEQAAKLVTIRDTGDGVEITTVGRPGEVRILQGSSSAAVSTSDSRSLEQEYRVTVPAHASEDLQMALALSGPASPGQEHQAADRARESLRLVHHGRTVLQQTEEEYRRLLARTHIFTPEGIINRGLQWAKVNTVRVQHVYKIGNGFTNDPPQDVIVIRDLAWYIMGSDYLTPGFSRSLLELTARYGFHEEGKVTEYLHGNEPLPERHDYHLNINDNTPLYICGLTHYAAVTGDTEFLSASYPLMRKAGEWIISQIVDGLVRCGAEGTNVWGICGWRNVVDGYTLNGAVTEVNAECVLALSRLASVAKRMHNAADEDRYKEAAAHLKEQINTQLVSERTGLYLLNIDKAGVRHHDVTGDLIFPVLLGVATEEMRRKILDRLTTEEFWTPYGTRTVSPREPAYDPDFGYQLLGGVWPNLTAWTAFCSRKDDPDRLIEGMVNAYRLSETSRPVEFGNVVPGEFPERLHGETFTSKGMTMSPWMPPTYLWLGVEGLLGVRPTLDDVELTPVIPSRWLWIAVKNLLCKGGTVTAFLYEGMLYASRPVKSGFPVSVCTVVETSTDNEAFFLIGMAAGKDLLLFVAADEETEGFVTIGTAPAVVTKKVHLLPGEAAFFRMTHGEENT
jgi:glycogen debranching enzyme